MEPLPILRRITIPLARVTLTEEDKAAARRAHAAESADATPSLHPSLARVLRENLSLLKELQLDHEGAWCDEEKEAVSDAIKNAENALRTEESPR